MPIKALPTLRVGHKVTLPVTTIDYYDAWYESVESCDYGNIPIFELPPDEYNQIMEECFARVDSEDEEVDEEKDGVINLVGSRFTLIHRMLGK